MHTKRNKRGRFSEMIKRHFDESFVGSVLRAYPAVGEKSSRRRVSGGKNPRRGLRHTVSRGIETSLLASLLPKLRTYFFTCRLRTYGVFFLSFGIYSLFLYFLTAYVGDPCQTGTSVFCSILMTLASLPLVFSGKSLSEALRDSGWDKRLEKAFGFRPETMHVEGYAGRSNIAFVMGLILGLLTYFIPAQMLLSFLGGILVVWVVFCLPESGIPLLFFAMPFLPTLILVALCCVTAFSFLLKLIRGNRTLRPEALDISVAVFGVIFFLGGVFSASALSLRPALVYGAFLAAYFMTVFFMNTDRWLSRCVNAAVFAGAIVSAIGVLQYVSGNLEAVSAWLDQSLFGDLSGRVVSTLENPNMLGEYLILLLPLALYTAIHAKAATARFYGWLSVVLMLTTLGMTYSRSAWIGGAVGLFVYLLLHKRGVFVCLLAAGVSIPVWLWLLPDSFARRLASIVNLSDSSIVYRINIWKGTAPMVKDFFWSGIGVGREAWSAVYPSYALEAIETAPHAHSLYLGTLAEVGIFGLAALFLVFFFLLQSNCRYFYELRRFSEAANRGLIRPTGVLSEKAGEINKRRYAAMRSYAWAPFCGVVAALLFGLTDYPWYNYRVYLMFWLVLALSSAYVRLGRRTLAESTDDGVKSNMSPHEADLEILLVTGKTPTKNAERKRIK